MHKAFTRKWIAAVGSLLVVVAAGQASDEKADIDAIVEPFLKGKKNLGIVVGIRRPTGHRVLGYGQVTLNGKQQTPAGDTLFEIGSITKIFSGTLLADQVLAGNIQLDDPVQKHLPKGVTLPRRDNRDITCLHLATHTSGLPVQPPWLVLFALGTTDPGNPYAKYDEKQLARSLANIKLTRPIGSRFEYSNLGGGLVGLALSRMARTRSFEELLIQRIARPLELGDTRIQLSAEQQKRLAPGYTAFGFQASPWTFASLEGAGALRSSANDLLTFADAALGGHKGLAKSFQMAHEPWRELRNKGEAIGLFWLRKKLPGGKTLLWHNGGTGGYRSYFAIVPETGLGVIVLSNSAHSVDAVGNTILQRLSN